jgi:hypothetical protein
MINLKKHSKSKILIIILLVLISLSCSKDDENLNPKNQAPSKFTLLTPNANKEDITRNTTFSWQQATDPDGDNVSYDLYIGFDLGTTELIVSDLSTTSYTLAELLDFDTQYLWRVVAKDGKGGVTESEVQSFKTEFPIVFLKKHTSMNEGTFIQSFFYTNGILNTLEINKGSSEWSIDYDSSTGKLLKFKQGSNTYYYTYTSTGGQERIQFADFIVSNIWEMEYDTQNRLISISNTSSTPASSFVSNTVLKYPDNESLKPFEIVIEINSTNIIGNEDQEIKFKLSLEWNGDNIDNIIVESTENGTSKEPRRLKYFYDNNINPYYIIINKQFGWDSFFISNVKTSLETLDFGSFYWQSANNITKLEIYDTLNASTPIETEVFEYTYTEKYYPKTADKQRNNINTTQLFWSY